MLVAGDTGVMKDSGRTSEDGSALNAATELEHRLRQQRVLAELGAVALKTSDIDHLLQEASALAARGMSTPLAKILCHDSSHGDLRLVAGVGWQPGIVGNVRLAADDTSPSGYAFQTGSGVISNDLEHEARFTVPALLKQHGVKSAVNVIIEGEKRRYGVLEVDDCEPGEFDAADLAFMIGFASMIGVALDRSHVEKRLKDAVSHQELLTKEASHRVKNSLAMVVALLSLQMKQTSNLEAKRLLGDAQSRIATITEAHDQLWKSDQPGVVDLGSLLGRLASVLGEQSPDHCISCEAESLPLQANIAISMGLLVTELATNAIKYAYENGGEITISMERRKNALEVTIADNGIGMPKDFDLARDGASGLGMRVIRSLARQIGAKVHFEDNKPGTRVIVTMPLTGAP